MAFQKWVGPLIASGVMSVGSLGCSSSSGGGASTETDAADGIHRMLDAGISLGDDSSAPDADIFPGTTGKACNADTDCNPDGGVGVNICSTGISAMVTTVTVNPWPTPICLPDIGAGAGNCDPAAGGGGPVFCDGDPTDPAAPGLCVPLDNPPQSGRGLCYPKCSFKLDGSQAVGCIGFDTCQPLEVVQDTKTNAVTGYGFCFGSCQKDSDCSALGATMTCQTDIGFCTPKKLMRTKQPGEACSLAATSTDTTTGACYCDGDSATGIGYCTSSCVVGGTACANGWICDADQSTSLDFGGGTLIPVTAQNTGFPGFCRPACSLTDGGVQPDAAPTSLDAGGDGAVPEGGAPAEAGPAASGSCPVNSTCQSLNVVGPDCIP